MITSHLIFFRFFDGAGIGPVVETGKSRAHKNQTRRDIDWNVDYVNLHKKIETKIETLEKAKEQVISKKVKTPSLDVNIVAELEKEIENLIKLIGYLETKVEYPKYQYQKKEKKVEVPDYSKTKKILSDVELELRKQAKEQKIKKILQMLYTTGIL